MSGQRCHFVAWHLDLVMSRQQGRTWQQDLETSNHLRSLRYLRRLSAAAAAWLTASAACASSRHAARWTISAQLSWCRPVQPSRALDALSAARSCAAVVQTEGTAAYKSVCLCCMVMWIALLLYRMGITCLSNLNAWSRKGSAIYMYILQ